MRQIKFRAWDYENEVMYNPEDVGIKPLTDRTSELTISGEGIFIRPDNENFELMEFTGLYDVNGKEYYFGDLFDYGGGRVGEVVFYERTICGSIDDKEPVSWINPEYYPKIGNKFDNPELLES